MLFGNGKREALSGFIPLSSPGTASVAWKEARS